jgi:hypothetical protein
MPAIVERLSSGATLAMPSAARASPSDSAMLSPIQFTFLELLELWNGTIRTVSAVKIRQKYIKHKKAPASLAMR